MAPVNDPPLAAPSAVPCSHPPLEDHDHLHLPNSGRPPVLYASISFAQDRTLMPTLQVSRPLAIAMWDFSWLERRWPSAGYEDWDRALDGLCERGYDAVRIDAYPHLVSADPARNWELLPQWTVQDWGAPARTRVTVQPDLNRFLERCAAHGVRVALSTWFRQDLDDTRLGLRTPQDLGRVWADTLAGLDPGVRGALLYVDLCNEFPIAPWAPFLPGQPDFRRAAPEGERWMREATDAVRARFPELPLTFSVCTEIDTWPGQDVGMLDLLEPHLWMAQWTDFYDRVGYAYERFDPAGYDNVARHAERLYRQSPEHWQAGLRRAVDTAADWSRASGRPLVTTEGWGIVDYKDGPLLDWGWVKELCELGVGLALDTRRWAALCTSNFCGPQFRGMWRDLAWHRRLTDRIHAAGLDPDVAPTEAPRLR